MKKEKLIHVGSFGQPHGLKGEVKINFLTVTSNSFIKLKEYFMDNETNKWNFKYFRNSNKKLIGLLEDYYDRDASLSLKGKKIYSLRDNSQKTKNNQYYIIDLVDCVVKNKKNENLGIIIDVRNFGASDLMEIKNQYKKTFYIPFDTNNLINVDIDKKIIIVNPQDGLLD
tara:strand:- start:8 stop:517 length:510 start_codon:yes stop_codon:yes gene_type:complete